MKYRRVSIGLELGSAAVEERLTEIALLMRETFPQCYWGQLDGNGQEHVREMHVMVNGRDVPVCFTDRELISYSRRQRQTSIDHRMHEVLVRLLR
ncbi:hypothetical protein [Noviherbaspirillum denitrificans]|uniref:Uncharacterized protein n=1 Tax=Noviherbaspirillum denitrificans TaxID=1968433 RepID=A0A254TGA1_9BURK|nr:hypothetical protein [Noviherbaspirillum denitrificans]OWW21686.1 hypothetical protein AYR66_21545 [Noviherbaspirillum denitrificans]